MDRLTKEEIERARRTRNVDDCLEALCDLALQSLSQEAVRDEVLEAERILKIISELEVTEQGVYTNAGKVMRQMARNYFALKREPNAAGTQGISGKSLGVMETLVAPLKTEPAPAAPDVRGCHVCSGPALKFGTGCALTNCPYRTAPDVASMVKRLRDCCVMIGYATSGAERASHKRNADAAEAALLAKLGQGWIPVSERLPNVEENRWSDQVLCLFDSGSINVEACFLHANREVSWHLAPRVTAKVTHWMPLPPAPGASDD